LRNRHFLDVIAISQERDARLRVLVSLALRQISIGQHDSH